MASLPPAKDDPATEKAGAELIPPPPREAEGDTVTTEVAAGGKRRVWHAGTLVYTGAGLAVLFFWLLWGDLAWQLKERSVHPVMQVLFKKFGATDMWVGILIGSFPQFLGMILQPIISYKSDRYRSRWGRRIPFLLLFTPLSALSMIALVFCPAMGTATHEALGPQSPGLNASVLTFFAIFWAMFEFSTIAANSVFGALVNDVVPHPLLGRFGGAMRIVSLSAGVIFSWWMMGWVKTHYIWIFGGIGVIYGLGVTLMCLVVKEGKYPPPPATHAFGPAGGSFAGARTYFAECFSNPYYVSFFLMMTLMQMSLSAVNLFNLFFAESMKVDLALYGKYQGWTYVASMILAYPLGSLADRFHPLRLGLVVLLIHGAFLLWGGLFIQDAGTFAFGFVATGILSGTWMTATASLQQRLFPRSRYAQFSSAMWLMSHIGLITIAPAIGKILDLTGHTYRYSYLASFFLVVFTFIVGLTVYRRFLQLGGPKHYVAPE